MADFTELFGIKGGIHHWLRPLQPFRGCHLLSCSLTTIILITASLFAQCHKWRRGTNENIESY